MSRSSRDDMGRMALLTAVAAAQVSNPVEPKKDKKPQTFLNNQGHFKVQAERNTQYTGARVANIQRKSPHR